MIYHPISQYVLYPDAFSDLVSTVMGERFFGIETNIDGQFLMLADDVTLAEKDALDALQHPIKKIVKINRFIRTPLDMFEPPIETDFVAGLDVKLHRKSIIVKGECQAEEFYQFNTNGVFSNLIVKEITTYVRNPLGFPAYKDVEVFWYMDDGTTHSKTKKWRSCYSALEQIQEGKTRRGNLVSNLQMPCIGLISIAMIGSTNATPSVILEGRRFLADYSKEFTIFVEDANRDIISCLTLPSHPHYASVQNYTWIDTMTPYGITIRQFIINEMTI